MNATAWFTRGVLAMFLGGCATAPTLEFSGTPPAKSTAGRATVVSVSPLIKDGRSITPLILAFMPGESDGAWAGYALEVVRPDGSHEHIRFDRAQELIFDTKHPLCFEFELTPDDAVPADADSTTWTRSLALTPVAGFRAPNDTGEMESRVYELRASVEPISIAREPALVADGASGIAAWTYPIFGLPRDLIDAPFTALNRMGFGTVLKSDGYDGPRRSEGATWWAIGGATWGGIGYGAVRGVRAAGPHLAKQFAYGIGYGFWSGFVFGGAAVGAVLGYAIVVIPTQTATLRAPYDDTYWKGKRPRIRLDPGWSDENVATWERDERSFAFFPNWRFGVRGEHRALPGADAPTVTVWVVRSIDVREIVASTP